MDYFCHLIVPMSLICTGEDLAGRSDMLNNFRHTTTHSASIIGHIRIFDDVFKILFCGYDLVLNCGTDLYELANSLTFFCQHGLGRCHEDASHLPPSVIFCMASCSTPPISPPPEIHWSKINITVRTIVAWSPDVVCLYRKYSRRFIICFLCGCCRSISHLPPYSLSSANRSIADLG